MLIDKWRSVLQIAEHEVEVVARPYLYRLMLSFPVLYHWSERPILLTPTPYDLGRVVGSPLKECPSWLDRLRSLSLEFLEETSFILLPTDASSTRFLLLRLDRLADDARH